MAKTTKSAQNERRFEVLTYFELTSAALEGCFGSINKGGYIEKAKKRIDDELRDFYKLFFTNKIHSNNLTDAGKYASVLIGKSLTQEESAEERMKVGLKHILDNLAYIKTDEYEKLEKESLEKLSRFFRGLAEITAKEADRIKF